MEAPMQKKSQTLSWNVSNLRDRKSVKKLKKICRQQRQNRKDVNYGR
jgi:hypothetical protein